MGEFFPSMKDSIAGAELQFSRAALSFCENLICLVLL